jgi:hypothetical protein
VSRLLVFPDDRTSRRRVERHQATFDAVLPSRTAAVRRWIRQPVGLLAGVLFLPDAPHPVSRHRVTRPNGRARAVARMDPAGRGAQH